MKTQPKIHLNALILPILMVVFLVMEILDPSNVWVILLIGLGSAWLISFLWIRSLSKSLRLVREMRFGWAQVGDRFEERFTLENPGWATGLWIEVTDESNLPGYQPDRVTGVDGRSSVEWHMDATCSRRGLYTIGPTSLETGDPFGIYTLRIPDPATRVVLVMPPVVALPSIEVAPGGRSGSGHPRSNAPERTVSASSVRPYVPGDNLHSIHWKTTARRDSPFVKIFDGTPTGDWRIVLDLDQNVQVGEGWDSTEEHGVVLAASLADRGLRMRRSVGLAVNGSETVWLPPQSGENQRWDILRALALVHPGGRNLGEFLRLVDPDIRPDTSLVLITPSQEDGWFKQLMPLVWRGVVPTILFLDPASFNLSPDASQTSQTQAVNKDRMAQLTNIGVNYYVITRDLLNKPESRPGREGKWEWRISPRGRAIAINRPADLDWRSLS
jgi:uncharacterized protein (DUF58 family)